MPIEKDEHQLGDFIKGRFQFIEDYCRKHGLDPAKAIEDVKKECLRLAGTPERAELLNNRLFQGLILSTSYVPDWVDSVFLEATTHALRGAGAPHFTKTSRLTCVAFEAGRFNAHRQSETIFKILFERKKPEEWLKSTFPVLYKKCYGDQAGGKLKVEELGPAHFRLTMDNRGLAKASQLDCSTAIGYLFGALERLGAKDPVVTHEACAMEPGSRSPVCVFEITWK
jgi:hypothetical protein